VTGLYRRNGRIEGIHLGRELISADAVVNAAGCWSSELAESAGLQLPVFPVRGQIVLTEALPHALNTCLSTTGCYLTQKAHGEVLIGSTTEKVGFDVSVTPDAITKMCQAAVRAVPMLSQVGIKRVWAGLRPGTPDELPVLGSVDEVSGYYNATGGFRTGIVAAPLTARLVAQCVTGEDPEVDINPYLAGRFAAAPAATPQIV
jgi:hydrogen cyanide synthase HcnC